MPRYIPSRQGNGGIEAGLRGALDIARVRCVLKGARRPNFARLAVRRPSVRSGREIPRERLTHSLTGDPYQIIPIWTT